MNTERVSKKRLMNISLTLEITHVEVRPRVCTWVSEGCIKGL